MSSARRNIHDVLLRPARFQIAVLIRKAQNRADRADVNPLRIGSGRVKRYSVRLLQAGRKGLLLLWLSVRRDSAKELHLSPLGFRPKKKPVRRRHHPPRVI